MARTSHAARRSLRIAMLGTRGVPAAYGGFETAVEEVGRRLADRGHRVTVYCRGAATPLREHLGMKLVHLPALHVKIGETLSHTGLSVAHAVASGRSDVAFVFNAANAPFVPLLRARGIPTAVHVDGLEWKRAKWSGAGRRYYRWAEEFSVRRADALIADAQGIADYYADEFGAPTSLIAYGAPLLVDTPATRLAELDLRADGYHLVVARFEPENHVDVIVEGFRHSSARMPLVVVGSAPYAAEYSARIAALAHGDTRIRLVGGIYDQQLLDQLYAHAATYLHGHSVGGTNPSLLRAMGAGAPVIAWDVRFNREVAGEAARYFSRPGDLTDVLAKAEADEEWRLHAGAALRRRASERYDWDEVSAAYERLALELAAGVTTRVGGRRRRTETDTPGYVLSSGESTPVLGLPTPSARTLESMHPNTRSTRIGRW